MLCLDCGKKQTASEPAHCCSCAAAFAHVPGVHGVNHVSQLLQAIDAHKEGKLDLTTLKDRFAAFEENWEAFVDQWDIADQSIAESLGLGDALLAVYGTMLERLEESLEHLNNAMDLLETLDSAQPDELERLEDEVRHFWRGSCSALAGLFQKLDTRGGDVDSLLSSFLGGA